MVRIPESGKKEIVIIRNYKADWTQKTFEHD
jgi:hypothetical protein